MQLKHGKVGRLEAKASCFAKATVPLCQLACNVHIIFICFVQPGHSVVCSSVHFVCLPIEVAKVLHRLMLHHRSWQPNAAIVGFCLCCHL